jgi:hypothetical protein
MRHPECLNQPRYNYIGPVVEYFRENSSDHEDEERHKQSWYAPCEEEFETRSIEGKAAGRSPFNLSACLDVERDLRRRSPDYQETEQLVEQWSQGGRGSPKDGSEYPKHHERLASGSCMDQNPEYCSIDDIKGQEGRQVQESEKQRQ